MTSTAGRLLRPAVAFLLLCLALPATGAGTGGIEISPYPGVVNGKQRTAFHVAVPSRGSTDVRYSLRNITDKVARGRLYAATAAPDGKGGYTIGGPGSSAYVSLPARDLVLQPRAVSLLTFKVHPGPDGRPAGKAYGALVVEVRSGAVTSRAATLVHLTPGRTVPLPLLIVLVAVGLLVAAGSTWLVVRRVRPRP